MSQFPIDYFDTPDGFTAAVRRSGIRIFAYADNSWVDLTYTKNALRRYQRGYVVDFVIHMNQQAIIQSASHPLNLQTVEYERDMASFLGFADNVNRIIRQAQPTHILHFSNYPDNDEAVYLQRTAKRERIQYELVHN